MQAAKKKCKITFKKDLPLIETSKTIIRLGCLQDLDSIVGYFKRNRKHLERWFPTFAKDFFTGKYWENRIQNSLDEFKKDQTMRFFAFDRNKKTQVIATINYTQIFRGPFHACYLGYGIDAGYEGKGIMSEAVSASIEFAFQKKNIHRIMANYLPVNSRSGNLLKRLGFQVEGYAREYLLVKGVWEDHILTSLTNPSWKQTKAQ